VRIVKAKGAELKATEQPIDTGTAAGKCFMDMLGVFAEFETNLRRERQLEGIAKAKAEGVYKGRPASIDVAKVRALKARGMGAPLRSLRRSKFTGQASTGYWKKHSRGPESYRHHLADRPARGRAAVWTAHGRGKRVTFAASERAILVVQCSCQSMKPLRQRHICVNDYSLLVSSGVG